MEGGAWGIVIIISAFMIQFIAFGISGSIGIYNIEFLENFDTNAFDVSLISSINLGMFLGTGPIASYLMDRYNHRSVVLAGGLMSSFGILVMPWLPKISYMYLFYGIINGLGGCLSYVPSHVLSGLYYDKYQGLSTGLATGGSGLGITVGPVVIAKLIEEYTWRGSLLILSGISFNVLVFGALLRPPPPRVIEEEVEAPIPTVSSKINNTLDDETKEKLREDKENNSTFTVSIPDPNLLSPDTAQTKPRKVETPKSIDSSKILDASDTTKSPLKANKEINVSTLSLNMLDLKPICLDDVVDVKQEKKRLKEQSYMHKVYKNVICNMDFVIYFINNIFWNFGLAVALAFLAGYTVQQGVSKIDSAVIVTIVGLGNFLGCLIGGVLSNVRRLDSIAAFCFVNVASGICLIMVTFVSGYRNYLIFSFLFGLFTGIILGYLLAITGEILGPEAFGDGVGIIMIANGIGAFAGPSVAGYLEKSYGLSSGLVVGGVFCIIGGLIILVIPLRRCFNKDTGVDGPELGIPETLINGGPKPVLVIPTITVDDVSDGKDVEPDAPDCSLRKNSFFKSVDLEDEK